MVLESDVMRLWRGMESWDTAPDRNPSSGEVDPASKTDREAEVAVVLDDVRPGIVADGGDVELVSIDHPSGVITVRLTGSCVGCPSATITMKFGIERIMLDRVPWVTAVQQTEDHEAPDWAEY